MKNVLVLPPVVWGGGPSREQKDAAAAQADNSRFQTQVAKEMVDVDRRYRGMIEPYATERLNNGLPYARDLLDFNGSTNSQAYLPARARLMKVLASSGDMPSGAKIGAITDFESARARDFDNSIANILALNETAKNNAAALLTGQQQQANPLGWSGAASQSNSSIMQAPLESQGFLAPVMGAAGSIMGGYLAGRKR